MSSEAVTEGIPDMDNINLFEDFRRFRQHPIRFLNDLRFSMTGADFAAYENYIGGRLYQLKDWQGRMTKHTLEQPVLTKCVDQLVNKELDREETLKLSAKQKKERERVSRAQIRQLLQRIAVKALPSFTRISVLRFEYFFFSQVLSRAYRQGMHLSKSEINRLRAKALECQSKKQSLVLLPCHKSHLDYISMVYACFRLGLSLPMTIAGDNLDIPLVSWFLRQVGATYIRRGNWKEDPLYNSFFQALITTILQQGYNIQCFIEGTRSRTGKLLPPKYGIMKFICEAVISGAVEDCWIVPISTQYDKVVEADTYATELMGREKKAENFMSLLESRSVMKVNFGRIDVRIGEGFSLKSFVTEQLAINSPRPVILRALAYKTLASINEVSVVMPSALVGATLLTTRQRGLSQDDLIYRVRRLITRIVDRGGHIGAIPKPEMELTTEDIALMVKNAIEVLGPDLVSIETKRLLEPVCYANDEFKLSYYRNQVVHLFVDEALICVCLYQSYHENLKLEIPFSTLERQVSFLSKLLSGEFVFDSNRELVSTMKEALGRLKSQSIVANFDENIVSINPFEVHNDWGYTCFYSYLVWPFVDGYWTAAMTLHLLPLNQPVKIKQFLDVAQLVANTLYSEGALMHEEACNREILASAVAQAESRKLVTRTRTTITLTADPIDLAKLIDDISRFRNDAKKRPSHSDLLLRVQNLGKSLVSSKL